MELTPVWCCCLAITVRLLVLLVLMVTRMAGVNWPDPRRMQKLQSSAVVETHKKEHQFYSTWDPTNPCKVIAYKFIFIIIYYYFLHLDQFKIR